MGRGVKCVLDKRWIHGVVIVMVVVGGDDKIRLNVRVVEVLAGFGVSVVSVYPVDDFWFEEEGAVL